MEQGEKDVLKDTINILFDWIRNRHPRSGRVEWMAGTPELPVVLELIIPEIELSSDERNYIPHEIKLFSMDKSTPGSLQGLERVRIHVSDMGGQLMMGMAPDKGLTVRFAFPTNEGHPQEALTKFRFIENEMKQRLKVNPAVT